MRPPHCKTGANEHAKACVKTGPGNSILFKLDAAPHAAPHVGRRTCEISTSEVYFHVKFLLQGTRENLRFVYSLTAAVVRNATQD